MFNCTICKKTVPPGTTCHKIIQSAMYQHPFRAKVKKRLVYDKNGKLKQEWVDDKGGVGQQIVKESAVCPECAARNGLRIGPK